MFAITTEPMTATEKEATAKPTATRIPSPEEFTGCPSSGVGGGPFQTQGKALGVGRQNASMLNAWSIGSSSRVQDHRRGRG